MLTSDERGQDANVQWYRRGRVKESPKRGQSEAGRCSKDASCLAEQQLNFLFFKSNYSCQLCNILL